MPRGREEKTPKKMKQAFLVFCEGATEKSYVQELRRRYRSPIRIVTICEGQSITNALIGREVKKEKVSPTDHIETFLMYDRDVPEVNARIEACDGIKICSNPCIELWFLLHSAEQHSSLGTDECIRSLKNSAKEWNSYKKGELSAPQSNLLWNNRSCAIQRAKSLVEGSNPSTGVYKLLESIQQSLLRAQNPL